jgi:LPXTG-motif cell wall-anchored protein
MGNTELNENVVNLQYSNNPNYDYKGINEPGQTNDDPDNPTYEPTSVTPDSKVNVYSTSVEVVKVNSNGNRLKGAKFQLKGDNLNQVVQVTEEYTPAGYLKDNIKDAYYKALTNAYVSSAPTSDSALYAAKEYVRYSKDDEGNYKTNLDGDYYLNKTTNEYVKVAETQVSSDLETDYIAYTKTDSLTLVDVATKEEECVGEVGSDGTIRFDGLSAGTYTLSEIEAPTGYSLLDSDITITVKFSKNATNKWTFKQDGGTAVSGTDATTTPESGKLALHVVNKEGSSLPSTGGIGTTIFYVAGSALVISAGVLLVTKKRMKKADK